LNGLNRPGPPWIGAGGARRGLLAWQARLASFPLHFPWIVDAQRALFREQLAKIFGKILLEKLRVLVRMCWDLSGFFTTKTDNPRSFLSLIW